MPASGGYAPPVSQEEIQQSIQQHARQAQAYLRANQPEPAANEFRAILALDPNNTDAFDTDLTSGVYLDRIQADFDGGMRSGVGGTPTFFTNGVRHDGPYAGSELLAALRATATAT